MPDMDFNTYSNIVRLLTPGVGGGGRPPALTPPQPGAQPETVVPSGKATSGAPSMDRWWKDSPYGQAMNLTKTSGAPTGAATEDTTGFWNNRDVLGKVMRGVGGQGLGQAGWLLGMALSGGAQNIRPFLQGQRDIQQQGLADKDRQQQDYAQKLFQAWAGNATQDQIAALKKQAEAAGLNWSAIWTMAQQLMLSRKKDLSAIQAGQRRTRFDPEGHYIGEMTDKEYEAFLKQWWIKKDFPTGTGQIMVTVNGHTYRTESALVMGFKNHEFTLDQIHAQPGYENWEPNAPSPRGGVAHPTSAEQQRLEKAITDIADNLAGVDPNSKDPMDLETLKRVKLLEDNYVKLAIRSGESRQDAIADIQAVDPTYQPAAVPAPGGGGTHQPRPGVEKKVYKLPTGVQMTGQQVIELIATGLAHQPPLSAQEIHDSLKKRGIDPADFGY